MARTVIMDHPLIQHKIGIIRKKDTSSKAVSYTHLDVYKRQIVPSSICEDARSLMNFTNFGWFWAKRSLRFFNSINFIGLTAILFSVLSIRTFF